MNDKNYPKHLALILDGNRRWGRAHGVKMNVDFYLNSGGLGLDVARHAFDGGVDNLTIWIGSVANLTKRSAIEIRALNKAYKLFFLDQDNLTFAHDMQIKIDCFGRWRELLEPTTVKAIEKAVDATAKYDKSGRRLTVLIAYDGTEERGAALEKVLESESNLAFARLSKNGETVSDEARNDGTEERRGRDDLMSAANLLRQNSWTGHLPDVDLIIRTGVGADPHNSAGFLSLLTDNAQYVFLETLWPDFTIEMFDQILEDYALRERRRGR
jgi:undecaprenyl diphosphate synthase